MFVTSTCMSGSDATSKKYSTQGVDTQIAICPQPYVPPNATFSVPPLWVSSTCMSGDKNNLGNSTIMNFCSNFTTITPGYFLNASAPCFPGNYSSLGHDYTSKY